MLNSLVHHKEHVLHLKFINERMVTSSKVFKITSCTHCCLTAEFAVHKQLTLLLKFLVVHMDIPSILITVN